MLTQLPNGRQLILLSSDIKLSPTQVIEAYGKPFKIEVCFPTLVHLLGGFAYQFWLKAMDKTPQFPPNLHLADYPDSVQRQIRQKVEAFKRFVNLNAIILGLLQTLFLELPDSVWRHFPRWFRTLPKHGYPRKKIVHLAIQHQQPMIFSRSRPTLLLPQSLMDKTEESAILNSLDLAA